MIRDLRFAWRRLARSPGFSATVILLLGLTLGANASMFSVLYGLLYKALPFAGADRIVSLDVRMANMGMNVGLSVRTSKRFRTRRRRWKPWLPIASARSAPATRMRPRRPTRLRWCSRRPSRCWARVPRSAA